MPVQTFKGLLSEKKWKDILKLLKEERAKITIAKRSPYRGALRSFSITEEGFEFKSTFKYPVNGGDSPPSALLVDPNPRHIMQFAKEYGNRLPEKKLIAKILLEIKKIKAEKAWRKSAEAGFHAD